MRIKVLYRKNLKMSEGKLAAQVAHAVKNLQMTLPGASTPIDSDIIVLTASDKKFTETVEMLKHEGYEYFVQIDKGLTEIPTGTMTTVAWIEK